jgi:hypothetical protein
MAGVTCKHVYIQIDFLSRMTRGPRPRSSPFDFRFWRSPRLRLTPRHIEFCRDLRWSHAIAVALFPTQSIRSTSLHLVRWNGSHKELHRLHPEWLHSEQSCSCQKRMASSRRCPHLLLASLIRPFGSSLAYGAYSQKERSSTTLRDILLGVVPFLLYARQSPRRCSRSFLTSLDLLDRVVAPLFDEF